MPNELDIKLINYAEAIKAEIRYDMSFNVNIPEFFAVRFQKFLQDQARVTFNIYRNYVPIHMR